MAEATQLRDPWLVAAWPGMGNVAIGAVGYIVVKLGATLAQEMPARDLFEVPHIEVVNGIAKPGRQPRNLFFEWRNPNRSGRDLLLFLSEAQPPMGGYSFCHKVLDYASSRGVKRLMTFAAMASQLHPAGTPRVFGAATDVSMLQTLESQEVHLLKEGQISGLNGVLLAAGAERNIPGVCLLGELPYFAAAVPNPKASQVVVEVFSSMTGIAIDLGDLQQQAKAVEAGLIQLLEKMQDAARQESEGGEEGFTAPDFLQTDNGDDEAADQTPGAPGQSPPSEASTPQPSIDPATRRRIDAMFNAAHQDRGKAFHLKQELDRLGVFQHYENRFLDLFKKAD